MENIKSFEEFHDLNKGKFGSDVEQHTGIYTSAEITGIKGKMISFEFKDSNESSTYKYGDERLSLPTYEARFSLMDPSSKEAKDVVLSM